MPGLEDFYEGRKSWDRTALDKFADDFGSWLTPGRIPLVDMLFDGVDLDYGHEAIGILMLAMTRLTAEHFSRREAFIKRFTTWLTGRGGRSDRDVARLFEGLK